MPLSIDSALLPLETKSPMKCIKNKASSSRTPKVHANSKRLHVDTRCRNPLLLDNTRLASKDKKYVPVMENDHSQVIQGNEKPLRVQELCCAAHDLFAKRDWKGAMEIYSRCIPILIEEIESNTVYEGKPVEKQHEDLLLLAYSNRAETYLRLSKYEDALSDATKALELNAKHWISLVRKGKALDGLEQFEQSVACYVAALHEEPKDEQTKNALMQSKLSYEQAHKGVYDLTKFILSGSEGDLPLCQDFVGPLEIRRSTLGGRGLFATRDLAIGELVLVSNALLVAPKESMVRELSSLVLSSKRRMQQLYTLSNNVNKEVEEDVEIPPMDLFTPLSYHNLKQTTCPYGRQSQLFYEGFDENQEKIDQKVNMERIAQIVEVNAVNVMDVIACAEPQHDHENPTSINYSGLWLLPSFINHSCTPNCVTSTPAGIAFVRVSRQIESGQELHIAYFDVMKSLEVRNKMSQQCHFACKCSRCAWEQSYPKELQSAREKLLLLVKNAIIDCMKCASPISRLRILPHLASLILSFETIIQSLDLDLDYQNWVRASIMDTYLAASRLLMSARMYVEPANRIQMLNLLVEAMKAGGGGDGEVMGIGVMLLNQVELHHGKESKEYCKTKATLRSVFKMFHGNLSGDVFHAMVASYSQLLNNLASKELVVAVDDLHEALVQLRDTIARAIAHFSPLQEVVQTSHSQDVDQMLNHNFEDDENSIMEFLSKIK
ncbi:unnamed protein product [Calypogeia fissa]